MRLLWRIERFLRELPLHFTRDGRAALKLMGDLEQELSGLLRERFENNEVVTPAQVKEEILNWWGEQAKPLIKFTVAPDPNDSTKVIVTSEDPAFMGFVEQVRDGNSDAR